MPSISDLVEVNPKRQLPAGFSVDEKASFIPMGDVSEEGAWVSRQARPLKDILAGFTPFLEGDVLFAKITPCMENGKGTHATDLMNGIGFGSTEFHVLRARPNISPRFVFHLSQSKRLRLAAEAYMIGSAGQQRVQKQFFDKYQVYPLSFAEQKKIAQILDTLDTQIRQTEALIAKLDLIKQGLLTDLLTRGIDQNGQLRPTPGHAPHLYKGSPLGQIPKDWSVGALDDLASMLVGPAFASERFADSPEGIRLLRGVNVTRGRIRWAERITVRWPYISSDLERYLLSDGDIVISMDGALVGKNTAMLTAQDLPSLLVQRVARIRVSRPWNTWIYMNIRSHRFLTHIDNVKTHTAIPHITARDIAEFPIPIPPKEEVKFSIERHAVISKRIIKECSTRDLLISISNGLMDGLLTGRVRVTPLLEAKGRAIA